MRYVTGMHALNLGDRSFTPGDWHFSAMDWAHPMWLDTDTSPFGMFDIAMHEVPGLGMAPLAGHVRACLDLVEQGLFGSAQGMREHFLDNPLTDGPVMSHVMLLYGRPDWPDIDRFMGREYRCDWLDYRASRKDACEEACENVQEGLASMVWTVNRRAHGEAVRAVLRGINSASDNPFILKGGTALMECYGLDRFCEDIDVDAARANVSSSRFFGAIESVCTKEGYAWRKAKATAAVCRAFIDYGDGERPLKVELSLRRPIVEAERTSVVDGILAYTISELCKQACAALMSRDGVCDLFDVAFIAERYYGELSHDAKDMLRMAFAYKDHGWFEHLVRTQPAPSIDPQLLKVRFAAALGRVGLPVGAWLG